MGKTVLHDEIARERVLAGAKILYDAVKTTMGPLGRNVVIDRQYGSPTITHDGVTVAEATEVIDTPETLGYKAGANLVKTAASKMNKLAGDGTTTVTVLTYHLLNEANKLIAAGHNPMELRRGLETASKAILERLSTLSEDITSDSKKVSQVATISAGDKEIGELISKVIAEVGKDGIVTVEEGQGLEMESDIVKGFTFDKGFVSPYMVTDSTRMEAIAKDTPILVTDHKIHSVQQLVPLLEELSKQNQKDLVIIADDIEGEALKFLILNKLKDTFRTIMIKTPSFGDSKKETLIDIATLTGATFVTGDQGYTLESATSGMLGVAKKVITTATETTIIEGQGAQEDIEARIIQIKKQSSASKDSYAKERYDARAAALSGKVAVIKVGGATETEIDEKKFRVDDAVAATKAALAEGIVAGGGVTLVNLSKEINGKTPSDTILYNALRKPFSILLENAGISADEWYHRVDEKIGFGINVTDPTKLIDLKKEGIIDPTKVTREAIQNAVSIAGTAMTMGALIINDIENTQTTAPQVPGLRP